MTEFDGTLLTVLTATCLVLLFVVLALLIRISSRIGRLESKSGTRSMDSESAHENPSEAESSAGGAFELFLSEDPMRRELSKAEQFGAYRKWRQAKGMNWSNS